MSHHHHAPCPPASHELRFEGLYCFSPSYAFPCDAHGNVAVALLSERAHSNFLRVRSSVGREFYAPVLCAHPRGN